MGNMREKIGLVLMLLILTMPSFRGAESLQSTSVVNFEDSNLEQCVKTELKIDSAVVTTDELANLTSLTCNNQNVSNISGIEQAANLSRLNLSNNNITDISSLSELDQLKTLDLSSNNITSINDLSNLTALTNLKISDNKINNISSINTLQNLERLEANSNQIEDISSLSDLSNLRYLQLNHNQITDINSISNLSNISQLLLDDNHITSMPDLSKLINLKQLSLSSNQITELTDISSTMISKLNVSDNQLTSFEQLGFSKTLKELNLSNNKINSLDGLESLSHLEELDLSYNQLSNIDNIIKSKELISLNLRNNQLVDISKISSLSNLQELNLSQNDIEQVSMLSNLENLKTLNISENKISDLSRLKKLESVNINAENQVIELEPKTMDTSKQVSYTIKGINEDTYSVNFNVDEVGTITYKKSWNSPRKNNYSFSGTIYQDITYRPKYPIVADKDKSINEEQQLSDTQLIDLFNVESKLNQNITVDQSAVDYSKPGIYKVVFKDEEFNQITSTLEIIDIKPKITTKTDSVVIDSSSGIIDYMKLYGPTATEIANGDLNSRITIDATAVNFEQPGTYNVKFKVTDEEGNVAKKNVDLTISNENSEVIISTVDPDVVVEGGHVKIYKSNTSNGDEDLGGFEYTIYDEDGNIIEVIVTDENGYAESDKLHPGHYYIERTGVPDNTTESINTPDNIVCQNTEEQSACLSSQNSTVNQNSAESEIGNQVLENKNEDSASETTDDINTQPIKSEVDSEQETNSVFEKNENNNRVIILVLVLIVVVTVIFILRTKVKNNG